MTDDQAVTNCLNGDNEQFEIVVRRYERELMGHALALLGNREDALDAVQETFLRAFKALASFTAGRRFYPWLYGILRNVCTDMHRRKAKEDEYRNIAWKPEEVCSGLAGIDERIQLIWKTLGRLSQEQREIIVLRHLEGKRYEEISELLEIASGTVMSRLSRARAKLKELLSSEGDD